MTELPNQTTARARRDLFLGGLFVLALSLLFISVDMVEFIFEATRDYENWELDELIAVMPALLLVLAWYSVRRAAEARALAEDLHRTHQQTLATEARLRDAQRLEALGRLAGGLAHELNNALQPVIVLCEVLLRRPDVPVDAKEKLQVALSGAEHGREIVTKTLTFAGNVQPQRESQVFAPLLRDVIGFARTTLPATVRLSLEIPDLPDKVHLSATELTQVMTNLFSNAARAMAHKGRISVSLGLQEAIPEVGQHLRLTVEDDGIGMDEETRRRLFDPFFSARGSATNVGLGLAVVHGIVQSWSGEIEVESRPGQGSRFILTIPVAAATP